MTEKRFTKGTEILKKENKDLKKQLQKEWGTYGDFE